VSACVEGVACWRRFQLDVHCLYQTVLKKFTAFPIRAYAVAVAAAAAGLRGIKLRTLWLHAGWRDARLIADRVLRLRSKSLT